MLVMRIVPHTGLLSRALLLGRPRDSPIRGLEARLRVGAVAERLLRGRAAAAERYRLLRGIDVPVRVPHLHHPADDVRSILPVVRSTKLLPAYLVHGFARSSSLSIRASGSSAPRLRFR